MSTLTVRRYMTPSPHTIGAEQTLATAARLFREHQIRHLPVLTAGRLVGMLTERDLALVEALRAVDAEKLLVAEAMTQGAYATSPDTSLEWVALEMAQHKYGSVVVVDRAKVVGVLTTIDALRALQDALAKSRRHHHQ